MGGEVAEVSVGANQCIRRGDVSHVVHRQVVRRALCAVRRNARQFRGWCAFRRTAHGGRRTHALRNSLVKPFLTLQERVESAQEHSGFSSLNDPMVVRAGDGDDFRGGDFANRSRRDDRALALHQARHRGDRAECAGIGQLNRAAGKVVRHQAVGARLVDQRLVGGVEGREIHCPGVLDHRHDQCPGAVLLLDVHREPQADRGRIHAVRLAVDFLEVVRHHREALGGLDDPVPNQVGEGNLLAARRELGVERLAARVEGGGGDVAERSRGRHRQRSGHVLN